jgi:hypothetical protein
LHFAILIGSADTGVDGATHVIIVHCFRTSVNGYSEWQVR